MSLLPADPPSAGLLAWEGPYCPYIHLADDLARPQPWSIPHRRLAHWLLVTSADGPERITVDGRTYEIPPDGAYLIQPGQLHDLGSPSGNRPVWIHFDLVWDPRRSGHPHAGAFDADLGPRLPLLQPDARAVFGVSLPVQIPPKSARAIRSTLPAIVARWKEGTRPSLLEATVDLSRLVAGLVVESLRDGDDQGHLTRLGRIERAERLAAARLDTGFDVNAMAKAAGWSRARFSRHYQEIRQVPPGEFLRRTRLRTAQDLLRQTALPVARIGALVGYPNPTVFARFFRDQTGLSPALWRQADGKV